MKVTLLGAAGGIGQSLSLLLKIQMPPGSTLSLYDIAPATPGIALDLSHIPTPIMVTGHCGEELSTALHGADIVLLAAGVARKLGMDRSDLLAVNAAIVSSLTEQIAEICPKALVALITNPLNSTVPIAAEVLKKAGVYDKRKLLGVTTLDSFRANTFVAALKGIQPQEVTVTVVGGHSCTTILPLFSQVSGLQLTQQEAEQLTRMVQNAGTKVVAAKGGQGSATLSMACAAAHFTLKLMRALRGEPGIELCTFTEVEGAPRRFFAQRLLFGRDGISGYPSIGPLSPAEQHAMETMVCQLQQDIAAGEKWYMDYLA